MNKNNIISAIIMFFLFAASVFSQEEISVLDTNFVDTQAVDTLIADTDTTSADTDTILEFSKKTSWYFSLSPRVGNDKIQKEYSDFLKKRADSLFSTVKKIGELKYIRQNWFQPATASGVSFYFETGVSLNLDSKSSLNIGAGYSFNRMKSIYKIENSFDSIQILKTVSRLSNNSFSLSADYKIGFDSSYFSIKGVDKAGFIGGAAFVLSRYSERDTIYSEFVQFSNKRYEKYDGLGGSVKTGLFAQKNIGKSSIFEYSIGYMFIAVNGYDGFWQREFYGNNSDNDGKILSISNLFILSFSLIF